MLVVEGRLRALAPRSYVGGWAASPFREQPACSPVTRLPYIDTADSYEEIRSAGARAAVLGLTLQWRC